MPIELKMPALSPTMEEGTLAKWLVKAGDRVASGDILAEIETDKATMEFEAVDEGTIGQLLVAEGTDGVKVGTTIATLLGENDDAPAHAPNAPAPDAPPAIAAAPPPEEKGYGADPVADAPILAAAPAPTPASPDVSPGDSGAHGERVKASPLARRLAEQRGIDLTTVVGSGPSGRIVKADLDQEPAEAAAGAPPPVAPLSARPSTPALIPDVPHESVKLSNMRRTIARRLTESKQTVPHIYLTVDVRLDALLALRGELNKALAGREIKLSVNDLLIKALALALIEVPSCNVMLAGDQLVTFARADISVAVSVPGGLVTPVIRAADTKPVSAIATEMKALGARARDGKLKPEDYAGGTASLSNMGMFGITQFDAVINPPQGMILALGAGEKRPWVSESAGGGDQLIVATVMSATGSFDHRAIDGADGARLMRAFRNLVEHPLRMLA